MLPLAVLAELLGGLPDGGEPRRVRGSQPPTIAHQHPGRSPGARVFYRVTLHNPPWREDFTLRPGEAGVSVFATVAQARSLAQWRKRRFGIEPQYIARVEIEPGAPIEVQRTRSRGHHELRGSAEDLLARCTEVVLQV